MTATGPNVLLLFSDQQGADAWGAAGNPDLRTPTMDAIAERGVRFKNAYCTFPLCSPSRSSMLSGRMPYVTGVTENGVPFCSSFAGPFIGTLMAESGYDCGYAGKWHLPELSLNADRYGFRPICGHDDRLLAEATVEFLRRRRSKPFFLMVSFDNPHNICEWARMQPLPWGEIDDAPAQDWPSLPTNLHVPAFEPQFIRAEMAAFPGAYSAPAGVDDHWWRHYRYAYYRLVERVDREVARIIDELARLRLIRDTLIIFTSDHGEACGAHRMRKKRFLYEESVRVPLAVSLEGEIHPQPDCNTSLVSMGLDLLPTICDYAHVALPCELDGRSLRPLLSDLQAQIRDHVIVATRGGRMVRTHEHKYVRYSWGWNREQLTDLGRDPGEMVNVAGESRYGQELDRHRAILDRWIAETGDPFEAPNRSDGYPARTNGV